MRSGGRRLISDAGRWSRLDAQHGAGRLLLFTITSRPSKEKLQRRGSGTREMKRERVCIEWRLLFGLDDCVKLFESIHCPKYCLPILMNEECRFLLKPSRCNIEGNFNHMYVIRLKHWQLVITFSYILLDHRRQSLPWVSYFIACLENENVPSALSSAFYFTADNKDKDVPSRTHFTHITEIK